VNIQDIQAEINAIDQETAQLENSGEQALFKKLLNIIGNYSLPLIIEK